MVNSLGRDFTKRFNRKIVVKHVAWVFIPPVFLTIVLEITDVFTLFGIY
jgi:hypothetical protein